MTTPASTASTYLIRRNLEPARLEEIGREFHGLFPREQRCQGSRRTSLGSLSSRRPLKEGWRRVLPWVHSVYSTSAMRRGSTKRASFQGTLSTKGLVSRA